MDKNPDSYQKQLLRKEYIGRINRVMDFIENNLGEDLNLAILADVACFSRFHFHRLFFALTGETLNNFIKRTRLERAGSLLMDKRKDSITEIAFQCGYSNTAVFSRAFREYFGMSATAFRNGGYKELSKIRKLHRNSNQSNSNTGKGNQGESNYFSAIDVKHKTNLIMKVEVKEMPEMYVAYVRHIGNYSEVGEAFEKLMRWAGPRGFLGGPDAKVLAVYHDDPGVTEVHKLRTSVCITVPKETRVDGELGTMKVAGGKYACGRFEINDQEFQGAWEAMMGGWLPESGYQCADALPYELYHNNHLDHPEKKHILDICIPVKPL
nr:AraC family transcriptional regulator [Bacteroidota bacterium]